MLNLSLVLNNKTLRVPIINEIGFNNHQMDEFWMMDIFKLLKPNPDEMLLDFGANVGQSLLKWKAIYPDNPYIGFEALPDCIEYLHKLIQINGFKNSEIIEKVIADKTGSAKLHLHYNDPTDRTASIVKSDLKVLKQLEVSAISYDDFIISNNIHEHKIKLCKIDIEGAEDTLLYAMEKNLKNQSTIIIVEILGQNYNDDSLSKLFDYMHSLSYDFYTIIKHNNRLKYLTKVKALSTSCPIEESDYFLIPKSYSLESFGTYIKVDP